MATCDWGYGRRMNMKTIMVVGPYRADSDWGVECNIQRAKAVAAQLWALNNPYPVPQLAVFCPHLNTAHFSGLVEESVFLVAGLEMVRRVDGLYCLPNWETSWGALRGVALAARTSRLGDKFITDRLTDVIRWLDGRLTPGEVQIMADEMGERAEGELEEWTRS
jgi:hypothetical protein